ncbi:hypothetical protein ACFE04_025096 [Oxalis oulophora]
MDVVASLSSYSPVPCGVVNKRLKNNIATTSSLTLFPLCSSKGLQRIFTNSYSPSNHTLFSLPTKSQAFTSLPSFNTTPYLLNKRSTSTLVNSGFADTGAPNSSYALSELNLVHKIRGICFYAVTAISAIFLFVLMVIAHPFVLLFDKYKRKAHHLVAKMWASLTMIPFLKIEFQGLENLPPADTPAVYVSNHQSFLDIYALLTLGRPFKFISKTAIFLYPIIGWAMFMLGSIPLRRMDSRSQLECLKKCMDLVKKGASVFFFPEGTRSKDEKLGAFKKGAFSVAAKTNVPVVPMTLIGTGKIMPAGEEGILNTGTVKVIIHKPIHGTNTEALCNEARNVIATALH